MIHALTAFTENIDDPAAAVMEIRTQPEKGEDLLKNSVGIIACHYSEEKLLDRAALVTSSEGHILTILCVF
jgi:hypothetical protein